MKYTCWVSHTCFVCSSVDGPRYHARLAGWEITSPCDTIPIEVEAPNRREAIKFIKKWYNDEFDPAEASKPKDNR